MRRGDSARRDGGTTRRTPDEQMPNSTGRAGTTVAVRSPATGRDRDNRQAPRPRHVGTQRGRGRVASPRRHPTLAAAVRSPATAARHSLCHPCDRPHQLLPRATGGRRPMCSRWAGSSAPATCSRRRVVRQGAGRTAVDRSGRGDRGRRHHGPAVRAVPDPGAVALSTDYPPGARRGPRGRSDAPLQSIIRTCCRILIYYASVEDPPAR